MQIFPNEGLAFFAVPRTGSTAFQAAFADVPGSVTLPAELKHMTVRRFEREGPGGAQSYERFAVIRDPLDRLRSWYRYRRRLEAGNERSTVGVTFAEFIAATLDEPDRGFVRFVGNQWEFLRTRTGALGVDHLFAHEVPAALADFLEERFGRQPDAGRVNESAAADTALPPALVGRLKAARAVEFALHARVVEAGGHLAGRGRL